MGTWDRLPEGINTLSFPVEGLSLLLFYIHLRIRAFSTHTLPTHIVYLPLYQ